MVRTLFVALLALIVGTSSPAGAQRVPMNADAIIARHIQARGGESALRALRTVVYDDGAYSENGQVEDTHAVMMLMRPYYKLVGHPQRSPQFLEGYDGAAWEWYGLSSDLTFNLRTVGAASEASRHYAEIEGPFLDYAAKGSRVELIGTASSGGRRAYQVRLTMMDGYVTDQFIDTQTFMIIASRHTAEIHAFGEAVTSETRFSDFRRVAGVMFPFVSSEVEIATGRELGAMRWGRIDVNVDIPVAWFSPPVFEHTPMQAFLEQIYSERTDTQAVLWTYHNFRRVHPELDTRSGIQTIGYNLLKMGNVEQAIALLDRNAADYPQNADAAFNLGRAYATAHRNADARREFQRALQLQPGHERATRALAALP